MKVCSSICRKKRKKAEVSAHFLLKGVNTINHFMLACSIFCNLVITDLFKWLKSAICKIINANEPGHEKMCLMSYANNKGADQPAHPCSLISAFVVRCLDSIISLDSIEEISRLQLASVAAHAGLCLAWSKTPEDTFCRVVAQMFYKNYKKDCE